jgi:hypothetical protein
MPNCFERLVEISDNAITVTLWQDDGKTYGTIDIPPRQEGDSIVADVMMADRLEAPAALNAAVGLANKRHLAIVVVDPHNLWQSAWGELYQS